MTAFNAVAEFAVAEIQFGGPPTLMAFPADTLTMADKPFRVSSGASIRIAVLDVFANDPGAVSEGAVGEFSTSEGAPVVRGTEGPDSLTIVDRDLRISAGKSLYLPADTLALIDRTVNFSISATISIPADQLWVSDRPFRVSSGASVRMPPDLAALSNGDFALRAGAAFRMSADALRLADKPFNVSISATISFLPEALLIADQPFRVSSGASMRIEIVKVLQNNSGAVADGANGEFAIGEGAVVNRMVSGPDAMTIVDRQYRISAGKSLFFPADLLNIIDKVVEFDSRSRRLKLLVIQS